MSMGWDYVSELRPATGLLFIPQIIYEYGEPRWNDTDRGKPKNSREKPVPVPLCPPQIPHGLTQASAVRDRWLTAWAMALPSETFEYSQKLPGVTTQKTTMWYSHRCGNLISPKDVPVELQAVAFCPPPPPRAPGWEGNKELILSEMFCVYIITRKYYRKDSMYTGNFIWIRGCNNGQTHKVEKF
jgi:hypothetical protein